MDLLHGPSRRAMMISGNTVNFALGSPRGWEMGVHNLRRDAHLLVQEFASGGPVFKRKHFKLRNENNNL